MSLPVFAWHHDERAILVVDGVELFAYDGEGGARVWRRSFDRRLVAVAYADSGTVAAPGADPFRTPSVARVAIVVDERGELHVVGPTHGEVVGKLNAVGTPRALVTSNAGDVALATDKALHLWRRGTQRVHEVPGVSAAAFSKDGNTLAIATPDGDLRTLARDASSERLLETFVMSGLGVVADLESHSSGAWLVAGIAGVGVIESGKTRRFDALWSSVERLGFDSTGEVLAVQTAASSIICYAWPKLSVVSRIELDGRNVRGMAFGRDRTLHVALEHGEMRTVDVRTSATRRASAPGSRAFDKRFALVGLALVGGGLRACSMSSAPEPQTINLSPELFASCDSTCAETRLEDLVSKCKTMAKCSIEAESALAAFRAGRCAEMTDALARARLGSNESIDAFRVAVTRAATNACDERPDP